HSLPQSRQRFHLPLVETVPPRRDFRSNGKCLRFFDARSDARCVASPPILINSLPGNNQIGSKTQNISSSASKDATARVFSIQGGSRLRLMLHLFHSRPAITLFLTLVFILTLLALTQPAKIRAKQELPAAQAKDDA